MRYLTYIFPVAAALFVVLIAWAWKSAFASRLPAEGEETPKKRFGFRFHCGRLDRIDALLMAVITLLYAVVGFIGLGDTDAPQSFCEFSERGRYVAVALPEGESLSSVRFYPGLRTGEYRAEVSSDGISWSDAGTVEQKYTSLFKWNDFAPESGISPVRYLRLTADRQLTMGELALYNEAGELIPAEKLTYDAGAAPLFDEQETVPERPSYMNGTYFDEIYHARTAYEHIENVKPYEITHPPLGKLIIGVGIRLFGMTPFGWRFSGTLFGVLMLPLLYILLKKLFSSTPLAACGTVVFAFDFMHFVQTRIATIDTYAVFFIILMYLFMWLYVAEGRLYNLALSGLFFGLGAACKWTCIYAGAGLAVIWLLNWIFRRNEEDFARKLTVNILQCCVFFIAVPLCVYYMSYYPYGRANGLSGAGMYFTKEYAQIVWDNQMYMWNYHSDLVATHPYSSNWYQWIADARPILYYLDRFDDGTKSAFGAFMNPVFCWGGLFAVISCAVLAVKDRDGKALFIVVGYLAQLLPWVLVTRCTFEYHYFPSEIFLLLALGYMFSRQSETDSRGAKRNMYAFTAVCVVLFAAFYPVLTGVRTPTWYTTAFLKWFPSWPF